MIFDRTQNDVDTAIRLINEKVKFDPVTMQPINPEALTETEIVTLEKGTLTINTLNRIENKQEELKNLFNDMGYWNTPITNKVWDFSGIFKGEDFDRILKNLEMLKNAFFVYKNTPNIPDNNYRKYQTINDVEKILYDLDVMINDVKSHYRECGNFECGE
jgi:hypothetical protein